MLGNLLSNAARYSPNPSAIRVSAVRESLHVAFSVTDQGQGVPTDQLPYLFRKFFRLDNEDSGRCDLAVEGRTCFICKGIVEAYGGRFWAWRVGAGVGTRFTFTIRWWRRSRQPGDGILSAISRLLGIPAEATERTGKSRGLVCTGGRSIPSEDTGVAPGPGVACSSGY